MRRRTKVLAAAGAAAIIPFGVAFAFVPSASAVDCTTAPNAANCTTASVSVAGSLTFTLNTPSIAWPYVPGQQSSIQAISWSVTDNDGAGSTVSQSVTSANFDNGAGQNFPASDVAAWDTSSASQQPLNANVNPGSTCTNGNCYTPVTLSTTTTPMAKTSTMDNGFAGSDNYQFGATYETKTSTAPQTAGANMPANLLAGTYSDAIQYVAAGN